MPKDKKKFWKHDCEVCMYLGSFTVGKEKYDTYFHPGKSDILKSVLCRFSNRPEDYSSFPLRILDRMFSEKSIDQTMECIVPLEISYMMYKYHSREK